jgi:peptidyl-prolyl cis-trans isomerase D
MLKSMRKHARYFYVLFFIVILTFIFWGVGTLDKPTSVSVAEVGDQKITVEEFWRTYERFRSMYRDLSGGQLDEEAEKKLKLKETVLNTLIEERVLLAAAKQWDVTVTDKELQEAIMRDQRFIRDGAFRKDVYFRTLELNRLTPDMFEYSLRQELTLQKIRRLIWSAVGVGPQDLAAAPGSDKPVDQKDAARLMEERNAAVKSYVESLKNSMQIKVNTNVIS